MAANHQLIAAILTLLLAPVVLADDRFEPVYPHKLVTKFEIGEGPKSYFLFEPDAPRPERAPVVVFHHGWLAMNPGVYGAWINHLVRSGNIVIYPRYMESETPLWEFLPNDMAAIEDAFSVLSSSPQHIKADRSRFAIIGHSTGGVLSAQVAALAQSRNLPLPKAVIAVTPGELFKMRGPNLADIPPESLLVVIAAEHDVVTGDGRAREIYRLASSLPPSRKKYVLFRTDLRGRPAIWADHLAPTASLLSFDTGEGPFHDIQMNQGATNAIDREGFWKVADITLKAGFSGKTLDEAMKERGSTLRLGYWSDGRPLIAPLITNDPRKVPRVMPSHGFRLFPWTMYELPKPDINP